MIHQKIVDELERIHKNDLTGEYPWVHGELQELKQGRDPQVSLLEHAVFDEQVRLVELVVPWIKPHYFSGFIFSEACSYGNTELVETLLPYVKGPFMDRALIWAAANGHIDTIQLILPVVGPLGIALAIGYALENKHVSTIDYLLEQVDSDIVLNDLAHCEANSFSSLDTLKALSELVEQRRIKNLKTVLHSEIQAFEDNATPHFKRKI